MTPRLYIHCSMSIFRTVMEKVFSFLLNTFLLTGTMCVPELDAFNHSMTSFS